MTQTISTYDDVPSIYDALDIRYSLLKIQYLEIVQTLKKNYVQVFFLVSSYTQTLCFV